MNYHNYQIGIKKAPTTWLNLDDEGIKRKIQSYTMSKVTTKEKKKCAYVYLMQCAEGKARAPCENPPPQKNSFMLLAISKVCIVKSLRE